MTEWKPVLRAGSAGQPSTLTLERHAWPKLNRARRATESSPISVRELADGRIIVAGGEMQVHKIALMSSDSHRADAADEYVGIGPYLPSRRHEIYDPVTKLWKNSAPAGAPGGPAVILDDGRVMKVGTVADESKPAEIYGKPDRRVLEISNAEGTAWTECPTGLGAGSRMRFNDQYKAFTVDARLFVSGVWRIPIRQPAARCRVVQRRNQPLGGIVGAQHQNQLGSSPGTDPRAEARERQDGGAAGGGVLMRRARKLLGVAVLSCAILLLARAGSAGAAVEAGRSSYAQDMPNGVRFVVGNDQWQPGRNYKSSADWLALNCTPSGCSLEPARLTVKAESWQGHYDDKPTRGQKLNFRRLKPGSGSVIAWFQLDAKHPWLKPGAVTTYAFQRGTHEAPGERRHARSRDRLAGWQAGHAGSPLRSRERGLSAAIA
ncbi:MAG: hypothetical protein IPQ15_18225 [Betaproteobacteria bacterium]|nr:hypothetical protein [Betaproteobacteria bacterium]